MLRSQKPCQVTQKLTSAHKGH